MPTVIGTCCCGGVGPCGPCDTLLSNYKITVSGVQDNSCTECLQYSYPPSWHGFNGTFILKWRGNCVWSSDELNRCFNSGGDACWALSIQSGIGECRLQSGYGDSFYHCPFTSFDCMNGGTLTLFFIANQPQCLPSSWPATIQVVPG